MSVPPLFRRHELRSCRDGQDDTFVAFAVPYFVAIELSQVCARSHVAGHSDG